MAGGSSSRPDTLMQTGSAANLDKPPCRRGGPYVYEDRSVRISIMAGGSSSRPDTLMQTGSAANLDKPPCRRGGPYVFESLDGPLVLSWMTGPRTDVGEAEFLEKLSDIARMKVDAEPLGDDALEVEPTPAHDPVLLAIRTRLDDLRELSQLLRRKARLGTLRPVVDEAFRSRRVEAMDPVTQRLAVHPADLRRRAPVYALP